MTYLTTVPNQKRTPQNQPIPGANQTPNSAGGYVFAVDDWTRLSRFLVLGSEGGSYYATETALTQANTQATLRCIQADGLRVVNEIIAISEAGRAPKNDPAIFALALASAFGDDATRRVALDTLPRVCRTGTHLFHFAAYVDGMRGWGRGLRAGIARWYEQMDAGKLAYQAVKYQQRDKWSHRDLLRLSHPVPGDETRKTIYHWITQGWPGVGDAPHPDESLRPVWAFERAKRAETAKEIVGLIAQYDLPREAIPTAFLDKPEVWEALLPTMPITALIRNLATLTRVGVLGRENAARVAETLTSEKRLRSARIHPITVLSALHTYSKGKGERGANEWKPIARIMDALDDAFYLSFGNVESTGKQFLLALDVSGSMALSTVAGVPGLTPRVASAAMALVTAATEPDYEIAGFCDALKRLTISPRQRLDDVVRTVSSLPFGATDCALPMAWAQKEKIKTDVFIVYTDSETWHGKIHPVQALKEYRDKMGIAARLVVVGMVANQFSIADPNDAGMLDVIGFDTATPQVIADFAK